MRGWFKRWFGRREFRVAIIQRDPSHLTVEEWRADKALVGNAAKLLTDPFIRQMLDTVRNQHIARYDLADNATMEQRAIRQAECAGFNIALNMIESLARYHVVMPMPEATFEAPEVSTVE